MASLAYGEYRYGDDIINLNRPSVFMWSSKMGVPSDTYTYNNNTRIIRFGDGREFTYRVNDLYENSTGRSYSYNATGMLTYGVYGTGSFGAPQFVISDTSIIINGQGTTTDLGPYTYENSTITVTGTPPAPWTSYKILRFSNDVTQDAYITDSSGRVYILTSATGTKKAPKLSRSSLRSSEIVTIKNPVINLVTDFVWGSGIEGLYDIGDPHLMYDGYSYYMTSSQSWGPELLDSTRKNLDIRVRKSNMPNSAVIVRKDQTIATYGVPLWKCDSHNLNSWQFYGNIFEADVNGVFWTGDEFYYCKMWAPQIMQLNEDSGKFVLIVSTARYPDYNTAYNNVRNLKDIGVFYAIADTVESFSINKVVPPVYTTGQGFDSYNGQAPNNRRTTLYPFIVSPDSGPSTALTGVSYSNFKCTPTPTTFIRANGLPHDYYSMCIDGDLMYDKELRVHYLCFVHDPNFAVSENIGIVQVEYDQGSERFSVVNSDCNVIYPFTSVAEFTAIYTALNGYCTSSCQITDTACNAACNYQLGASEYANTWGNRGVNSFSVEGPSLMKRRSSNGTFYYYLFYSGGEYNGRQYSINYVAAPSVSELRSGSTTRWHGRFLSQMSNSLSGSPTYSFGHGHHARPGPDGHIYYSYHMTDLTRVVAGGAPRQACISRMDFFQSKADPTKGDAYIYPVQGNFTLGENKKVKGF